MLSSETMATLQKICKNITFEENMKMHTTLKVGGRVDACLWPSSQKEFLATIRALKKLGLAFRVVGNCSNIVFPDEKLEICVIFTTHLKGLETNLKTRTLTAFAGETMASCFGEALKYGLSGFERLAGIPGTIGASIRGNAGCFGSQISDILKSVKVVTQKGKIKHLSASDLEFGYRTSVLPKSGDIVISADFELGRLAPSVMMSEVKECAAKRKQSQPALPSCGCVFKKHGEVSAGLLIDEAGLKGARVGGCMISDKHANFIVNLGDGTAEDYKTLAEIARTKVKHIFGIDLEREVEYI